VTKERSLQPRLGSPLSFPVAAALPLPLRSPPRCFSHPRCATAPRSDQRLSVSFDSSYLSLVGEHANEHAEEALARLIESAYHRLPGTPRHLVTFFFLSGYFLVKLSHLVTRRALSKFRLSEQTSKHFHSTSHGAIMLPRMLRQGDIPTLTCNGSPVCVTSKHSLLVFLIGFDRFLILAQQKRHTTSDTCDESCEHLCSHGLIIVVVDFGQIVSDRDFLL
jgi:hypothetical protein